MNRRDAIAALVSAALLGAHGQAQVRDSRHRPVSVSPVQLDQTSGPAQDADRREPPAAQPQNAANRGQVAFDRICKSCHGPEARGDAGPRLVPFSREYEELLGIVREGQGQMPPISVRELPDTDVAQIVAYLKSRSQ